MVRHGESEANAGLRTEAPGTVRLTGTGHRQAHEFAAQLDETPSLIVTSPFRRTALTAAPLRARFPHVPHEEWPIEEFTYLSPAACANSTYDERRPLIETFWARRDPHHHEGPGTESFAQLLIRARAALARFSQTPPGLTVIFSHAQFMRAVRLVARHPDHEPDALMSAFVEEARREPIANCAVMMFERDEGVSRKSAPACFAGQT